ncbi:unnamed protein product [Brachionus calyciflorus]|uniref:Uncharacterized protein n=1 Tax=Brachionus calyciflorus TaxID=104777 RepID=A0A814H3N9_9BILA|nr:unnamed protein product [Brachionus calyciflorus]
MSKNFSKENNQVNGLDTEKLDNLSYAVENAEDLKEFSLIDFFDKDDFYEKATDSIFKQLYDSFNDQILEVDYQHYFRPADHLMRQ